MLAWDHVWATVVAEFSEGTDAEEVTQLVVRLAVAALLGGVLGLEREMHGKAAGIRTHMLVALGSALFVLVPLQMGYGDDSMSRVVQGLLAGVGFLCAGSIIKSRDEDEIHGLTTAAGLWMTAAIGVAAGVGREATAVISTLIALVILALEGPLRKLKGDRPKNH